MDAANPPHEFNPFVGHKPIIYPCHGEGSNQIFFNTKRKEVRFIHSTDLCLTCQEANVVLTTCSSKVQGRLPPAADQTWHYDFKRKTLRNDQCKMCLTRGYGEELKLEPCTGNADQRFEWKTTDMIKTIVESV